MVRFYKLSEIGGSADRIRDGQRNFDWSENEEVLEVF